MADNLETRARKAILNIEKKVSSILNIEKRVNSIYAILDDLGLKLTHALEYKFDYHTFPKGIDYGD